MHLNCQLSEVSLRKCKYNWLLNFLHVMKHAFVPTFEYDRSFVIFRALFSVELYGENGILLGCTKMG
jgi:hypothetical protein